MLGSTRAEGVLGRGHRPAHGMEAEKMAERDAPPLLRPRRENKPGAPDGDDLSGSGRLRAVGGPAHVCASAAAVWSRTRFAPMLFVEPSIYMTLRFRESRESERLLSLHSARRATKWILLR